MSPERSHNYLRITRILKCLSELGLEHLNIGFLLHVLNEQSESKGPTGTQLNSRSIQSSMDRWWANCLRHEEDRRWIGEEIKRVRQGQGFVFTRGMYEDTLERRRRSGRLTEEWCTYSKEIMILTFWYIIRCHWQTQYIFQGFNYCNTIHWLTRRQKTLMSLEREAVFVRLILVDVWGSSKQRRFR